MLRLAIRVPREQAELVLAQIIELAPAGVEEVDVDEATVEYAVYGAPGELPELPDLRAAVGELLVDVSTTEIADDWADRWREFHRPLVLGERLSVRPPWEPPQRCAIDLVIDPGRAFGTGAHATTRLCLELLLELEPPLAADPQGGAERPAQPAQGGGAETGAPSHAQPGQADGPRACVDLGCGSGVLAIAAAKLGWQPVLALDHDPLSVEATAQNARVNAVEGLVEVRQLDLLEQPVPAAPLVLANLLAPLLLRWCEQLRDGFAPVPGMVIASGLLVGEADAVAAGFAQVGLRETRRMVGGEWAALLFDGAAGR